MHGRPWHARMVNLTGEANTTRSLSQAPRLSLGLVTFLSALNIFLSITAFLGNALMLVALRKVSSLHPPTKLLFRCLAVTDLCVGLISQPLFVVFLFNDVTAMNANIFRNIIHAIYASGFILFLMSVSTSTAISVDRLLALLLGLRYRHVVTLRRVRAVLIYFWLIGVSDVLMYFFLSYRIAITAAIAYAIICLAISVLAYTKIFLKLREHKTQVQDHICQGQPNILNITRYKKTVSSIALVQLALVACHVPFAVVVLTLDTNRGRSVVAWNCTVSLLYIYSSLNPFLYSWKIPDVREAMKDSIKQFLCWFTS